MPKRKPDGTRGPFQIGKGTFRVWDVSGPRPLVVAWVARANDSTADTYWGYRPDYFLGYAPREGRGRSWLFELCGTATPSQFRDWVTQTDATAQGVDPNEILWKHSTETDWP